MGECRSVTSTRLRFFFVNITKKLLNSKTHWDVLFFDYLNHKRKNSRLGLPHLGKRRKKEHSKIFPPCKSCTSQAWVLACLGGRRIEKEEGDDDSITLQFFYSFIFNFYLFKIFIYFYYLLLEPWTYLLSKSYTCHLDLTTLCLPSKNLRELANLDIAKNQQAPLEFVPLPN